MPHRIAGCFIALVLLVSPGLAETLQVVGAGSLSEAFTDLIRRFPAGTDTIAMPEFGPSGLMREKIELGMNADLFASADMEQARRLAMGHPERSVIHFTRNRLCAIARTAVGLTEANMLERLLDPAVRLATSTPGADPGGDYAFAVFARAEAVRTGARAALAAKALKLYGGGEKTPLLVPARAPSRAFSSAIEPMWPSAIAAEPQPSCVRFRASPFYPYRQSFRSDRPTAWCSSIPSR